MIRTGTYRDKKKSETDHRSQAQQNGKITKKGGGIKGTNLKRINIQDIEN